MSRAGGGICLKTDGCSSAPTRLLRPPSHSLAVQGADGSAAAQVLHTQAVLRAHNVRDNPAALACKRCKHTIATVKPECRLQHALNMWQAAHVSTSKPAGATASESRSAGLGPPTIRRCAGSCLDAGVHPLVVLV